MRVKANLKFGKKTQYIITIENTEWGILTKKVLQTFSDVSEWEVNEDEIESLKSEIRKFAKKRFYDYIAYRERSIKEIELFFNKLPIHKSISDEIISKAIENRLISDDRFANLKIKSLISRKKSKNEIILQLKQFGLEQENVNKTINKIYTEEIENEILKYNIDKAKKKYSKFSPKKAKTKSYQSLLRKGFSYEKLKKYFVD